MILVGTIQILCKHSEWVGGVSQMLMLYAKPVHFTNEVCLQGGWVGGSRNGPKYAYVIFERSLINF